MLLKIQRFRKDSMVKLEDAVIARLEKAGHKFELLVDSNLVADIKHGKDCLEMLNGFFAFVNPLVIRRASRLPASIPLIF